MLFVADTLASIVHYTGIPRRIILVDNTGTNSCLPLQAQFPDVDVVVTPEVHGRFAGIYLTTSLGYLHAVGNYKFNVILRMDTDALVVGDAPEQDALSFFLANPTVGALGSYRVDCNSEPRSFTGAGRRLRAETSLFPAVHPRCLRPYLLLRLKPDCYRGFTLLRALRARALVHGYHDGEHFMGGAVFLSGECVRRLAAADLLYRRDLRWSRLEEDHLFSLMIRSLGMEIADFVTGDRPMGLRWRGLPSSPEALLTRGKKVVHSTRFWNTMTEDEIRRFFRERRNTAS
jgi:hypothetical protein